MQWCRKRQESKTLPEQSNTASNNQDSGYTSADSNDTDLITDYIVVCEEVIDLCNQKQSTDGERVTLSKLVRLQDATTFSHATRLVGLVKAIAQELDFSDEAVIEVCDAARYHDLGKINIPAEILNKPGRLTPAEFEIVKRHSADGAEMIMKLSPDWVNIANGIRTHHERVDGSGYPDGLVGDEIPIIGRIIAVADVYDALTHNRPYRDASYDDVYARTFLKDHSGLYFDSRVVSAFVAIQITETRSA